VTALLEYLDLENHFYANYALKLYQNSRIILDSFTPSLFLKFFQHNSYIPIYNAENYVNRDLAAVASLVAHALNNLSGTGD